MSTKTIDYDARRPIDLICMGRVAVDLYAEQIGASLADAQSFRKYLGGCAGNIAVGSARLGLSSMMFSCVGADEMGRFLKKTLHAEGVATDLLFESAEHLTGLVLLGVKPPHEFPLMFYRRDCADMQLKAEQVDAAWMAQAKALLITGTALSTDSMRTATWQAVRVARENGTAVVFDLDYRPVLWGLTTAGNGEARYIRAQEVSAVYQEILAQCDLIVGTEEEIALAGGHDALPDALAALRRHTQASIVVKLGEKGCQVHSVDRRAPIDSEPFPVEVLNVLGAGDAFMSGLLRGLLRGESWQQACRFANACGALVVTRHGCAPAMPFWDELRYFMQEYPADPLVWKRLGSGLQRPQTAVIKQDGPFPDGLTRIVDKDAVAHPTGMNFSAVKLRMGEQFVTNVDLEFAALLMTGRVRFHFAGQCVEAERVDYFAQAPLVLHCPRATPARIEALSDCEVLLIETENDQDFEPMFFDESNMLELDHRGQELLENTSYRIVRTVFDKRNRPESNLVVGEIITFQGRWSSYPPHYHSQPEIYHYRFSEPQGFAFGENGQEPVRIEHNDTYQIAEGQEHAHCTAPGYALYTLWFIRHEPDNPYIMPTFRPEHEWTRQPSSRHRVWKQESRV
ncbi:5-dehydro-2-deoxygluconokinase [Legionella sp. CNM-4043-24]|uniref:5-dehydro-2-deoxygluconokinase n=1 Tax=Legionella sp. CNM-4043-24 TaxID=3421646 RepID=UPI00403B3148